MRKRSGQVHSRESSATLQLTVSLLYPVWDSLVVEIDGLLYNGTINCMFDTDSFPGIV